MVHAANFSVIAGHLYKMGNDKILRRFAPKYEQSQIFAEVHGGAVGGHYVGGAIVEKIICVGLWWPTLHQDSKAHFKARDICQRTCKPSQRNKMPLNPQLMLQPFENWAIDFVGPIKPQGKMGVRYIITATEYLTCCAEVYPVKDCMTVKFLFEHVLT